jgi:hypothetical protein
VREYFAVYWWVLRSFGVGMGCEEWVGLEWTAGPLVEERSWLGSIGVMIAGLDDERPQGAVMITAWLGYEVEPSWLWSLKREISYSDRTDALKSKYPQRDCSFD